jgi:hypothetical protein
MSNEEPEFPPPPKPLSFNQLVHKILEDHKYADFLHGLILKARDGHQDAADLVFKHFQPLPEELDQLKLPRELLTMKDVHDARCTTTFMLADFAAPAHTLYW